MFFQSFQDFWGLVGWWHMTSRKMPRNPTGNCYKELRCACRLNLQYWVW